MKKFYFYLTFILLQTIFSLSLSACSSDNGESLPSTETIDFYGTTIPYRPMAEQEFPEWLRQLKNDKKMMGLYRICMGTLNDKIVYHLDLWTDSYIGGRLYDGDGNNIDFKLDDFLSQVRNFICIYNTHFE